jgi:hypothetical protein
VGEEATFFSLGALVGEVEQRDHGVELIIDGELLEHPDICDTGGECKDDHGIGGARDLVVHLAEVLDILAEGLARALTHGTQVIERERALVRALEVGDELSA